MARKWTALLCVKILLAVADRPAKVLAVRVENSLSDATEASDPAANCNVALLTEDYGAQEVQMLHDNHCKCYHDDPYAWHAVTSAEACLGTEKRRLACRWDNGACDSLPQAEVEELQEECEALDWAPDPEGCHNFGPLGCISDDPRPLALGGNNVSAVHLLTNDKDEVCYWNSAIVALFAGSNGLVPHLQGNAGGECFRSIRRSLAHIVRAMRNQPMVHEEGYVRKLMKCVRANCAEEDNADRLMLYLARKEDPSGEPLGVLKGIFLPAMNLTWKVHDLEYADCDEAPGIISCLHLLGEQHEHLTYQPQHAAGGEDLQIFVFNQRKNAKFKKDFQLFEAGGQLTVQGVNYSMWSGTAKTSLHVMAWTIQPQAAPRLTVYDDQPPVGIQEFPDVEAGFANLGRNGHLHRIQMIIFKKVQA